MHTTSQTTSNAVRSAFANPVVSGVLNGTVEQNFGNPIGSLFQVFEEAVQRYLTPTDAQTYDSLLPMMLGRNDYRVAGAMAQDANVTALRELLQSTAPAACGCPGGSPSIELVTVFEFDDVKQVPVAGEPVASAAPGTVVTVFGRNFAPSPSDNRVMFRDQAVPVILATRTTLTVGVPALYGLAVTSLDAYFTGETALSVETVAGRASAPFVITSLDDLPDDGDRLTQSFDRFRELQALILDNNALHQAWTDRALASGDPSGRLSRVEAQQPGLLSQEIQGMNRMMQLIDRLATPEFRRMASRMVAASGILDDVDDLIADGRGQDIAWMKGSGFIKWYCRITKLVWKWVAVLYLITIVLIILIILTSETGIIPIILAVVATVVAVVMFYMLIKVIYMTIRYIILKLWEWATGLLGVGEFGTGPGVERPAGFGNRGVERGFDGPFVAVPQPVDVR